MTPLPLPSSSSRWRRAGFIRVEVLFLLALLPLGAFLFLNAEKRRLQDAHRFAGPRGTTPEHERQRRRDFCRLIAGAGFIIFALARPAWIEEPVSSWRDGRDLVFLLDVSRSMLAQDLSPNRLGAAKTAIRDCVESLKGDRVALVLFAGSTSILCPLTDDYDFFFDKLEEAHPDFVAPGDVRVGGTRIGDAIHKICDKLLSEERRGFQDLILLSDGGDQDSNPLKAAKRLENLGVHFLVAGLGDAITGARIPARGEPSPTPEYVVYEGKEVWTKLEAKSLETLAKSSRYGIFLNAGTRALPLGNIYQKLAVHFQRHPTGKREELMRKQETFPLFLGLALFFLAAPPGKRRRPAATSLLALLTAAFCLLPGAANAASPGRLFRHGLEQFAARNFAGSLDSFRAAAEGFAEPERRAVALYNAGLACYNQALADEPLDPLTASSYYRQSCEAYRAALEMLPTLDDARWNLELALRRLARLTREGEESKPSDEKSDDKSQDPSKDQEPSKQDSDEQNRQQSDQEIASQSNTQMNGEKAMDLDAQDIPPPAVEPDEILQQERDSNETRQKHSASKYKPVEKDW